MSRKVELVLEVKLVVEVDEGVSMQTVVDELDYEFNNPDSGSFNIVDTEIRDYKVVDSK